MTMTCQIHSLIFWTPLATISGIICYILVLTTILLGACIMACERKGILNCLDNSLCLCAVLNCWLCWYCGTAESMWMNHAIISYLIQLMRWRSFVHILAFFEMRIGSWLSRRNGRMSISLTICIKWSHSQRTCLFRLLSWCWHNKIHIQKNPLVRT